MYATHNSCVRFSGVIDVSSWKPRANLGLLSQDIRQWCWLDGGNDIDLTADAPDAASLITNQQQTYPALPSCILCIIRRPHVLERGRGGLINDCDAAADV
ncbi:hypothetical protein Zmor_025038 [Zophobas morio]|uniref:Uncharacterized protein n=1 Tax=Zophobas morio TaxID=2755281 RepID=A0AA38HQU7_9CUCU|nr:hypothetical protein Zmor_025038 [Zophobas morio]